MTRTDSRVWLPSSFEVLTRNMHTVIGHETVYVDDAEEHWARIVDVRPSPHQGWNFVLVNAEGREIVLQSCWGDTPIKVRHRTS